MFDGLVLRAVAEAMTPKVVAWLNHQGCDDEESTHDLQQAFEDAIAWDAYKVARDARVRA